MIKNEFVYLVQQNFIHKQAEENAREYSLQIARKNALETALLILLFIMIFVFAGIVGNIDYLSMSWYNRSGGGTMIYGLTEADLQRIDKEAVKKMIAEKEKRLNIWSIPNYEKKQIEEEIKQLKELLKP